MTKPPANLQSGFTVAQAARLMNVSERSVYSARKLLASGRDDLVAEVEAGRMSLHAALNLARPSKYDERKDGLKALRRSWQQATDGERASFLAGLCPSLSSST